MSDEEFRALGKHRIQVSQFCKRLVVLWVTMLHVTSWDFVFCSSPKTKQLAPNGLRRHLFLCNYALKSSVIHTYTLQAFFLGDLKYWIRPPRKTYFPRAKLNFGFIFSEWRLSEDISWEAFYISFFIASVVCISLS